MKRKVVCSALVVALFTMFALGSGSSSSSSTGVKEISSVQSSSSDEASQDDSLVGTTSEIVGGNVGGDSQKTESDSGTAAAASSDSITVEEQVLLDQDGIRITATGIDDGWFGTELKLLIENDSNKNLTFQARNSSVNGYMVDTLMSEDVASGKKSNTSLTFSTTGLKDSGIDTIANMEFSFHIFTTEEWETVLDTPIILVQTSKAGSYTQQYDDSGKVIYDQGGVKIVGKGLSDDNSWFGPGLIVYIENNSNQDITVQVRDTSINGFMVDTSMSQDVIVGKKAISAVTFFNSSLEENGITTINSVETSFHIFNMETWDTIVDTDPITIQF